MNYNEKKMKIMEEWFECCSEYGMTEISVAKFAKQSGISQGLLYIYFNNLDDLIIQSTEYCMAKVEDEFMEKSPNNINDLERFIDEIPYWTAKKHGKKYRLMYQVYTNPKYLENGKEFFKGVSERYTEYAKKIEVKIGIPYDITISLIFIFIRACVHYALFEDEFYLKTQLKVLKEGIKLYILNKNKGGNK